jgi:predicted permease
LAVCSPGKVFALDGVGQSVFALGGVFSNNVLLGLPLAKVALGDAAVPSVALVLVFNALILWTLLTVSIEWAQHGSFSLQGFAQTARGVLTNPIVAAILSGTLFGLIGLPLPTLVALPLAMIGQAAAPMALIALGMGLAEYGVRDGWRISVAISVLKLIVQPLVVWLLARLIGLPAMETRVVVLLASLAVGVNVYLMSRQFNTLEGPVASSLVLSTALAALTTPLAADADLAVDRPALRANPTYGSTATTAGRCRRRGARRWRAGTRCATARSVRKSPTERLGDHSLVAAAVFAEQQAQLLGFDDTGGTACLAVQHQRFGDVARHPFLVGEAVANGVDQPGDAAKAVQATAGQVGDVGEAAKRAPGGAGRRHARQCRGRPPDRCAGRQNHRRARSPGRGRSRRAGGAARVRARVAAFAPYARHRARCRRRPAGRRQRARRRPGRKLWWRGMPMSHSGRGAWASCCSRT